MKPPAAARRPLLLCALAAAAAFSFLLVAPPPPLAAHLSTLLLTFPASPYAPRPKLLFLLAGQSNMAGRGLAPSRLPPPFLPHPRVIRLAASRRWVVAAPPLHGDADQKPPPSDDCEEMPAWRAAGPRERPGAVLRFAQPMMLLAAGCSIMGTFFLLLSMVDAIQLKFGIVSCGTPLAVGATFGLSALVVSGLIFYGSTVAYAVTHYLP